MKVTTLCQCRGTDKLYTLIKLSEPSDDLILTATTPDRKALPSNLVQLSKDEYVLVLADLNVNQIISLTRRDANESSPLYESEIQPRAFALASKINGRLKKGLCARIRNIDFSGMDCPNNITCDLLSFTPYGQILVGQISGVEQNDCSAIAVLNDRGEAIGRPETTIFTAESPESRVLDYEVKIFRTEDDHGLVVAAVDSSGNYTGGFRCLKERSMRELIDTSVRYFMTAFDDPAYDEWIGVRRLNQAQADEQRTMCAKIMSDPTFSIIVPLYHTPLDLFDEMLDSVLRQTYPHWELILVNSTPENAALAEHVNERANNDDRIELIVLDRNYGITENTNRGIDASTGDYICFFDHDDTIEPNLLYEYYKAIADDPETTMLYCDEDRLLGKQFVNPAFKPDFSIDLLRSNNYLCHMLCISREAYESVEPQDSTLDGAQDHALTLKVAELGRPIKHIPKVLYHWRITPNSTAASADAKPYAAQAGIKAIGNHLKRTGISGYAGFDYQGSFRYRTFHRVPKDLKASIIVPILDELANPMDWIHGLLNSTDFEDYEILMVTNLDTIKERFRSVISKSRSPIRVVEVNEEPNPARFMNVGAKSATGDAFIFLRNGYLPVQEQWMDELVGFTRRDDAGIVGTMTCSPNGLIDQAGLTFTDTNVVKLSKNLGFGEKGYAGFPISVRDVSLLGPDCIAMSRHVFERYTGFSSEYSTYYSVYDLCFRALDDRLWNVYTPHSRVMPMPTGRPQAIKSDKWTYSYEDHQLLFTSWGKMLKKGDPFFSNAFSKDPRFAETYKLDKLIIN